MVRCKRLNDLLLLALMRINSLILSFTLCSLVDFILYNLPFRARLNRLRWSRSWMRNPQIIPLAVAHPSQKTSKLLHFRPQLQRVSLKKSLPTSLQEPIGPSLVRPVLSLVLARGREDYQRETVTKALLRRGLCPPLKGHQQLQILLLCRS